ncbi:MAG: hypothetical protein IPN90_11430 [Elusimicrobia bacterium]|nr:hypothetical protein [Elusimicrobiota bacterium]
MSKTKSKPSTVPPGVFLPGADLSDYLEKRGDLRALFDRVHTYFFENPGAPDPLQEIQPKTADHRLRKGGSHAHGHAR